MTECQLMERAIADTRSLLASMGKSQRWLKAWERAIRASSEEVGRGVKSLWR
jgi:hypothetical protein